MPLVLAAQWGVRDWSAPVTLKFLVVCGSVGVVLLVSYELLVRYTWVGALLNGRKFRPAR
jgi:glucan biosynthesis protein C